MAYLSNIAVLLIGITDKICTMKNTLAKPLDQPHSISSKKAMMLKVSLQWKRKGQRKQLTSRKYLENTYFEKYYYVSILAPPTDNESSFHKHLSITA